MLPPVDLPLVHRGKVRELYDAGDGLLLMIASDRISAFDVVMTEPIPHKGRVLTAISVFWFHQLAGVAANHLVSTDPGDLPETARRPELAGRSLLVRRAEMIPVECIVRGYLAGSAWKEYQASGTVHGITLPAGLRLGDRLPEPLFTPSTKAPDGHHDVNITYDEAADLAGADVVAEARRLSLDVYEHGSRHAHQRGIVVADTKLELGLVAGELVIADELLTPDSSRFWPTTGWTPGRPPPSFDKQPLRDHLDALDWDKRPPPPALPAAVVAATSQRYREAYERLTGSPLDV